MSNDLLFLVLGFLGGGIVGSLAALKLQFKSDKIEPIKVPQHKKVRAKRKPRVVVNSDAKYWRSGKWEKDLENLEQ